MTKRNFTKIFILYLTYKTIITDLNLGLLKSIALNLFPTNSIITFLIIDNSLDNHHQVIDDEIILISGNNQMLDFSGWDAGFKYLENNYIIEPNDILMYVNDTFFRRNYALGGNQYLKFFSRDFIQPYPNKNLAIGYLDDFPKPVSLLGISYKNWIRSNIYILSFDLSKRLYPFCFPIDPNHIFSENSKIFFKPNIYISENWQNYISCWLFGIENFQFPEYKLKWLKSEPLTESNRLYFQKKCMAILSEHYLSARLHQMNINIINTNFFDQKDDRHTSPYYS